MIEKELRNFDIRQIAESGQCFRMTELAAAETAVSAYRVISGSRMVDVVQRGSRVTFDCTEEDFPYWEEYFDLKTDYGEYISSIDENDDYLRRAAAFGSGIRILKQDVWEMIITFVISQQKTIPNIRALVEALCREYGSRVEISAGSFYDTFPAPEQLNAASLTDLQALKLGYRAKYIKKLCEDACSGALDLGLLKQMNAQAAMTYLQGFYGIGKKVASCVCLFGLHHVDAFPIDTWIRKILMREYACRCRSSTLERLPQARRCEYLVGRYFSGYAGYAGVMQQYMFHYEIHCGKTGRV